MKTKAAMKPTAPTHQRIARACAMAFILALSPLAGGAVMAAPPVAVSPGQVAPVPATPGEISSYAAREQHAPADLAKFEGGARLVIGGSVLVLVLVVLILVLIL